jgi:predicted Zn-dependent protease
MPQTKSIPPAPTPVLLALESELQRNWTAFQKLPTPPYYLAYEVADMHAIRVSGSFGTLVSSSESRNRFLDIDLRIGSPTLDNSRPIRGTMPIFADNFNSISIPYEDDTAALKAAIWYNTDQRYKRSLEQWIAIQTNVKVKAETTDKAGDFVLAPPEKYVEPEQVRSKIDRKLWETKVRQYTAPLKRYGNLYQAQATLSAQVETRTFVSSEGSRILTSEPYYRLSITAFAKADDGMELPKAETYYSATLQGLPRDEEVLAAVTKMAKELQLLKLAPVLDPYTGPAILSPRATGVFFHEIFGHRIEGQRAKQEGDAQTFKDKVGQKVLPEFLSVYSDPTLRRLNGKELSGCYRYDNQGIKARRVPVVEKGILKNFLMSRTPIDNFPTSNGHGRRQPGYQVEARQSNLIVQADSPLPRAQLKQRLIEEVKKAGLPFGLYFEDVQGGFTLPGRERPNSFTVIPVTVYRIYPDGNEELVRGVDLIGTPLTTFSKIVAAGDDPDAFNGMCGATSGSVPVSAAGPSLLVAQVEVQKKPKSQERSPILPLPFDDPALGTFFEILAGGQR